MDKLKSMRKCPKCSITWIGDAIPQEYQDIYDDKHFSANVIGIEYGYGLKERYDGISEYRCLGCDTRFGRWTGMEIPAGYVESRYGSRGIVFADM